MPMIQEDLTIITERLRALPSDWQIVFAGIGMHASELLNVFEEAQLYRDEYYRPVAGEPNRWGHP